MAEGGVPIAVIMAKAGHISPKMTQHYTQISAQMQRRWARHMEDIKKMPTPDWTHEQRRAMA
jgi:hypothetical protein